MAAKRRPYKTTRRFPTKKKTTTKEGKRAYMKQYMRVRRAELIGGAEEICKIDLGSTLGIDLKKLGKRK